MALPSIVFTEELNFDKEKFSQSGNKSQECECLREGSKYKFFVKSSLQCRALNSQKIPNKFAKVKEKERLEVVKNEKVIKEGVIATKSVCYPEGQGGKSVARRCVIERTVIGKNKKGFQTFVAGEGSVRTGQGFVRNFGEKIRLEDGTKSAYSSPKYALFLRLLKELKEQNKLNSSNIRKISKSLNLDLRVTSKTTPIVNNLLSGGSISYYDSGEGYWFSVIGGGEVFTKISTGEKKVNNLSIEDFNTKKLRKFNNKKQAENTLFNNQTSTKGERSLGVEKSGCFAQATSDKVAYYKDGYVYVFSLLKEEKLSPKNLKVRLEEQQSSLWPSASSLNELNTKSVPALIGRTIKIIMQVIGTAALLMFIYGGLLIMTSRGESEKYNQGMKVMFWSAIGTITVLASYALVSFVFSAF